MDNIRTCQLSRFPPTTFLAKDIFVGISLTKVWKVPELLLQLLVIKPKNMAMKDKKMDRDTSDSRKVD